MPPGRLVEVVLGFAGYNVQCEISYCRLSTASLCNQTSVINTWSALISNRNKTGEEQRSVGEDQIPHGQ